MTEPRRVRPVARPSRLSRYRSAAFLRLYAIGGCTALLVGLLVSYVSLVATGNAGPLQTDFVAYYSAAHLVITGAGSHIYNLAAFGRYERALVHPLTVRNGVLPYVYPPYMAILTAPLGALSYGTAWLLWFGINLVLAVATIASLQRYLSLGRMGAVLLWAASLSFLPIFVAVAQGQTSIVLLAFLTAAFFAARSRHAWLAGVLLSLALVKPQYVLPILLVLAVQRLWAPLVAFIACSIFLFALPVLVIGPGIETTYLHTLQWYSGWHGQFGSASSLNQSVSGSLQLLMSPSLAFPITVVVGLAAAGLLARAGYRSSQLDIPYALAVVAAVALSPHVLIHDLSLLLLPVAIAVRYRRRGPGHLAPLLLAGSLAVLAGMRLASLVPIQLSVLAMLALSIWLYRVDPRPVQAAPRSASVSLLPSPMPRPHSLLEDV